MESSVAAAEAPWELSTKVRPDEGTVADAVATGALNSGLDLAIQKSCLIINVYGYKLLLFSMASTNLTETGRYSSRVND